MKKLIFIWALLACVLFVGCSEDDNAPAPEFKVLSTTAKFDAAGGEGKILVQSPAAITAKAEEDWCTVKVSGMTVNVTVPMNETIIGRTAMVAITAGGETLRVPVYQAGDVFICDLEDYSFPMEGGSRIFSLKTAREVSVSGVPGWLSYEMQEDGILFTAEEADGDRLARVTITCGLNNSVSALFSQWSVEGTYTLSFEDNNGVKKTGTAEVSKGSDDYLDVKTTGMVLNATLKASYSEENRMIFSFGQLLGYASGYAAVLCGFTSDSYLTWSPSVQYAAVAELDKKNGEVRFRFGDNGTYSGSEGIITGFYYGAFDEDVKTWQQTGWGVALNIVMTKRLPLQ